MQINIREYQRPTWGQAGLKHITLMSCIIYYMVVTVVPSLQMAKLRHKTKSLETWSQQLVSGGARVLTRRLEVPESLSLL